MNTLTTLCAGLCDAVLKDEAPVAPTTLPVKRSLIESAIYTIQQSDTSSGCCMCGDSMPTHDNGMHSGHAPCDSGDYHAQGVLKELREALL